LRDGTLLEGSVRRSGNKIRVNAQLIDARTDAHLWAEQFDGDIGDLFALQNGITSRIAIALNLELTNREAARPTEHSDALDYILLGRAEYWKPNSREKFAGDDKPVREGLGARSIFRRGGEPAGQYARGARRESMDRNA
jgi:hypothetical protein